MISDKRIDQVEQAASRGKATHAGVALVCRELRSSRAALEALQKTEKAAWSALELVLNEHRVRDFRAKARAWFGRRLVLSVVPVP